MFIIHQLNEKNLIKCSSNEDVFKLDDGRKVKFKQKVVILAKTDTENVSIESVVIEEIPMLPSKEAI